MKYLFLLSYLLCISFAKAHDTPVANFTLFENEQLLEMEIEFDKKNLEFAVTNRGDLSPSPSAMNRLIRQYLNDHIAVKINGLVAKLQILDIEEIGHHILIKGQILKNSPTIKKINFTTNCLTGMIDGQNNILVADVNCVTRGFRLTKNRLSVLLEY